MKSDELLLELRDRSIDSSIGNRTHVLRYNIGPAGVERIDPVALQPQDFVDEWLTRPWSEMESRSSSNQRDDLKKWHNLLDGIFDAGHFNFVQPCTGKAAETPAERPSGNPGDERHDQEGNWQVSVTLEWAAGKKLSQPITRYFMVHGLGKYRFEMAAISVDPPDDCPGQSR